MLTAPAESCSRPQRERPRWLVAAVAVTVVVVTGLVGGAPAARGASSPPSGWQNRFTGPGVGFDGARAMVVSPDGSQLLVTGSSTASHGLDYLTQAINATTGATQWTRRYDGPAHGDDQAIALVDSPDGSTVFVTGTSASSTDGPDMLTEAINTSDGTVRWTHRYDGPTGGNSTPVAVGVSPDGSQVYVAGTSQSPSTGQDYVVQMLNAQTGSPTSLVRYTSPGDNTDTATGMAVIPNGSGIVLTGTSTETTTGPDYATIAWSPTGHHLWTALYNDRNNGADQASGIAVSPNSQQVFVTGTIPVTTGGTDDYTLAYQTTTGTKQWATPFSIDPGATNNPPTIAVSNDSATLYLAASDPDPQDGSGVSVGAADIATSTGQVSWRRAIGAEPGTIVRGIAGSGRDVFVGVTGQDGAGNHYFDVLELGPSYSTGYVWGPYSDANEGAYRIALSSDGKTLYATGQDALTRGEDYFTVSAATCDLDDGACANR